MIWNCIEFRYGLNNLTSRERLGLGQLDTPEDIERQVNCRDFYDGIQIKPRVDDRIVLDEAIVRLTNMLFVGAGHGNLLGSVGQRALLFRHPRNFLFAPDHLFHRRSVCTLGRHAVQAFEQRQEQFERYQDIGYKDSSSECR